MAHKTLSLASYARDRRILCVVRTAAHPEPRTLVSSALPELDSLRLVGDLPGVVGAGIWRWSGEPLGCWWSASDRHSDRLLSLEAHAQVLGAKLPDLPGRLTSLEQLVDLKWSLLEIAEDHGVWPLPSIEVLPGGPLPRNSFLGDPKSPLGRIRVGGQILGIGVGANTSGAVDAIWGWTAPGAAWSTTKPQRQPAPKPAPKAAATPLPAPPASRLHEIAAAVAEGRLRAARTTKMCFSTASAPRPSDGAVKLSASLKANRKIARTTIVYFTPFTPSYLISNEVETRFQVLIASVESALAEVAMAKRESGWGPGSNWGYDRD